MSAVRSTVRHQALNTKHDLFGFYYACFINFNREGKLLLKKSYRLSKSLSDLSFVIGKWILIIMMFSIFLGVFIQVFFRYVLNQPLLAPTELTTWFMVWAGYFGASVTLRTEEHISLQILIQKTQGRTRFSVKILSRLIVLFFVIFFTIFGFEQALTNKAFSWAVNMKVMYAMFGIPLAGLLMLTHMIYLILNDFVHEFNFIAEGELQ